MDFYRRIYVDFDSTRFDPLRAGGTEWAAAATWRQLMDEASKRAIKASGQ
jgi:hypothetical protein